MIARHAMPKIMNEVDKYFEDRDLYENGKS